jgi:hypothetical protein
MVFCSPSSITSGLPSNEYRLMKVTPVQRYGPDLVPEDQEVVIEKTDKANERARKHRQQNGGKWRKNSAGGAPDYGGQSQSGNDYRRRDGSAAGHWGGQQRRGGFSGYKNYNSDAPKKNNWKKKKQWSENDRRSNANNPNFKGGGGSKNPYPKSKRH